MNNKDDIQLSEQELEKVNRIIEGIQSDLNLAIEKLKSGDFDSALSYIKEGISKSNCPLCKRELGILIADVVHNKEICILKSDSCEEEQSSVIGKAIELKEDFVPVIQTKKAIKDKRNSIGNINKTSSNSTSFLPPHLLFSQLFPHKRG